MTEQRDQFESSGAVVVGVDGSPNAEQALAWALSKSVSLGPVSPLMTFTTPSPVASIGMALATDPALFRRDAEARLGEVVNKADPSLAVRSRVVEGHAGVELCRAAEGAALLVVGSRGTGLLRGGLTGSTSIYCAEHSSVPVAVIPQEVPSDRPLRNIVVGVDGSRNAEAALRWAIDHIDDGGRIVAVGAFPLWGYIDGKFDPPREVMEAHVRKRVEESVERVTGSVPLGGPDIQIHVEPRDARVALRQLAGSKVDLLVVGSRGRSGIPFLLLGSVATALLHHPKVATVVVPVAEEQDA